MSAQDVVAKLDCTVDYAYFRTLIQKVMKRRGSSDISAEEFRSMLVRIDDQIVKQHNARELALLAKPIFDFLLLRDTPPDVSIPLKPILVFFEDKKMSILRDYIESICRIRQRSEITLDELTTLVEDLYLGQTTPSPPAPPPEAQIAPGPDPPRPEHPAGEEAPSGAAPEAAAADTEAGPGGDTGAGDAAGVKEEGPLLPAEEIGGYEPTIEIPASSVLDFFTEEPDGRDDSPLPEEPRPQSSSPVPLPKKPSPPLKPERAHDPAPEGPGPPQSYERLFAVHSPEISRTSGAHRRTIKEQIRETAVRQE